MSFDDRTAIEINQLIYAFMHAWQADHDYEETLDKKIAKQGAATVQYVRRKSVQLISPLTSHHQEQQQQQNAGASPGEVPGGLSPASQSLSPSRLRNCMFILNDRRE